ncbi:MAG: ATP-binding protein [Sphingomonadales bacterium]|nr:ATP-binding protein [Sphingomonadales bacterium]
MLKQNPVTQNAIVTGLRGVGKTVLLETLKPIAQNEGWLWTGNDLSESTSLTEDRVARRLVVDISTLLGPLVAFSLTTPAIGFGATANQETRQLSFDDLWSIYEQTPGLTIDKIQAVFVRVADLIKDAPIKGIVFAYDEAQNLADHSSAKEYPLSLILDLFSSLQRKWYAKQFLLVLTGLPTLFPKLNESRTYTERMFHVMQLDRLSDDDAREAVVEPLKITKSSLGFSANTVEVIVKMSGGYPYFIQFMGKEVFDAWIGKITQGEAPSAPMDEILEKLDQDFFNPRWVRATDRQQQFMQVIATLPNGEDEFSVPEIVKASRIKLKTGFSPSHAVQILQALSERGLIYKNRRGSYCFAVPLLARYIQRQAWDPTSLHPGS